MILLGYTFRHQLFVYSCFTRLLFARLFILLLFSCLLSCYLVIIWLQFFWLLFYAHCFYARVSSLHTHTHQVAFWRPWICTSRYWTLVLLCRYSMRPYILRGAWVLFLLFWYSHLSYFPVISWFYLYRIQLPFSFRDSSAMMVLDFICIIAVIYGLDL